MKVVTPLNKETNQINTGPSQPGLQNTPTVSLQRSKTPPNECPDYDTKQSDGEALVMLKIWGVWWSTPSLESLPGPLWPGVVASYRVLSMGQIELFDI